MGKYLNSRFYKQIDRQCSLWESVRESEREAKAELRGKREEREVGYATLYMYMYIAIWYLS